MMPTARVVDETARAILDGTPVDWGSLESNADSDTRALVEQLKLLSTVASVHRAEATAVPVSVPSRPAPEPDPPDGIGRWGHLQLLELVGSGAFGDVYRAWDTRLDREVALKLMHAGAARTDGSSPVIQEGRLLARVRHPNVATIYGAELIDDRIGLWMEFVHGRTLEELLGSGHRFSVSDVVEIGREICRAVSAVHAAGLLHRDIKAQNVMRAGDGRVVLMDFGTGFDRSDGEPDTAGTPLYLAPEVFRGESATVRSDVYSVGVLLHYLLTGDYPVKAKTLEDLRRAHERGERVDLHDVRPDLPEAVVLLVRRAMDPDPERRYDTCDALAADLPAVERGLNRRRWTAALALVAGAGVVAWFGWAAGGQLGPSRTGAGPAHAGIWAWFTRPAPTPAARPAVAVLPFSYVGSLPESALVVDGLTYELIRNLAVIDGLDVRSATSSFAFRDMPRNLAEIGRQLGVDLVVEGSVFSTDGQWRVHAQLVQVAGDTPLWARKFDRGIDDVFAIQDEIALAVVNELRLTLGRGQRRYDLDAEASALYLQARALVERRGTASAQAAIPLFEQVIARDPSFAPAYAGLADAYSFMSQELPDVGGLSPEQAIALMRPATEAALDRDPLLAEAHAAMGMLHAREFAWDDADRSFRRAIELNPGLTHIHTSYSLSTLLPLGRFDEAEVLLGEALRRDPLSLEVRRELGLVQLTSERYREAIDNLEQVDAADPDFPYVKLLLARSRSLAGRIDEALPYWDSVSTQLGFQHWLAYAYMRAGRRAEIERIAAGHQNPYRLALFHAALGNLDQALEALDEAADRAPHRVVRLLVYPELASLRSDPRFAAIRAKFRLP